MSEYERNLQRFSDMEDVEVSEDDPDVRGWDVLTREGHDIGEVKDLLVDTSSMKVRCLEIELEVERRFRIIASYITLPEIRFNQQYVRESNIGETNSSVNSQNGSH
jgi:sporulation protein YlmC with PRC-barrel domain